jgi:hypothetical protein
LNTVTGIISGLGNVAWLVLVEELCPLHPLKTKLKMTVRMMRGTAREWQAVWNSFMKNPPPNSLLNIFIERFADT